MSVQIARSGNLSEKRLNGIYWKTFVGFVNKDNEEPPDSGTNRNRSQKREGRFEYMELTTKDDVSLISETESRTSDENSMSEPRNENCAANMYAVLDMSEKKEIHINDEVAIFDGSPIRRSETVDRIDQDEEMFNDCCEVPYEEELNSCEQPRQFSLPWKGECISIQRWMLPSFCSDDEDEFFAIPDYAPPPECEFNHYIPTLEAIMEESEEGNDSYDDLQNQFSRHNILENGAESWPSEDSSERTGWNSINDLSEFSGRSQDDLFSTTSTCGSFGSMRRISTFENLSFDEGGCDDISDGSSDELDRAAIVLQDEMRSQGDLEKDHEELVRAYDELRRSYSDLNQNNRETINSVEDFDGDQCVNTEQENIETGDVRPEPNTNIELLTRIPYIDDDDEEHIEISTEFPSKNENNYGAQKTTGKEEVEATAVKLEILAVPKVEYAGSSVSTDSPRTFVSSVGAIASSTTPSWSETESEADQITTSVQTSPHTERDNGPSPQYIGSSPIPRLSLDDVISEEDVISLAGSSSESEEESGIAEPDLSEIPADLDFGGNEIPEIVVMFAKEELAKEEAKKETNALKTKEMTYNQNSLPYRKRSSTCEPEGLYGSGNFTNKAVHNRLQHLRNNETSRLSAMSSSTPELSVMTEDALPYIPVSYATEAFKRKRKRRATISSVETAGKRNVALRALQTKTKISGTGLGSSFSTLRKKFTRKRANTVKRSQSERRSYYYSSPDVSLSASRIDSPRQSPKSEPETSPNVEPRRRRGFKSVVSNIFRRISSRFSTSQNFPSSSSNDVKNKRDVIKTSLDRKKNPVLIKEQPDENNTSSINEPGIVDTSSHQNGDVVSKQTNSEKTSPDARDFSQEFRRRSYSVPMRPHSASPSPRKNNRGKSDIFMMSSSPEYGLKRDVYV